MADDMLAIAAMAANAVLQDEEMDEETDESNDTYISIPKIRKRRFWKKKEK